MVLENFLIDVDILWDRVGKGLYEKPEAGAGRKMRVKVVNSGVVEDLTGYTLNLGWKSQKDPTKFGLDAFEVVDVTKGIFEIAYTSGMLSNLGYLTGALQLVPTVGEPIESNNFVITVVKSAVDAEAIQSETSFTALALALVDVNAWNATIDGKVIDWEADMAATKQLYIDNMNEVELTYPQELVSLGEQLAQTNILSSEAVAKADAMASGSPKGVYATLYALQTAYPTGTTGAYLVTGDGKWYYWSGSAWTVGGTYQATGIADKSVTLSKLDDKIANNQLTSFGINNTQATSVFTVDILSAIKSLKLYGFDKTKKHKIRLIGRNHASFFYRFIISVENSVGVWADVFDTTSAFVITENVNGYTKVENIIGTKKVEMMIDYPSLAASGAIFTDMDFADAKYIILNHCFVDPIDFPVFTDTPQRNMVATKTGTTAKIKFKYSDSQNMVVEFGLLGINELSHMKKISLENSNVLTSDFTNLVDFHLISSDWVSPYGLTAVNNPLTSFAGTVGGNHGTVGAAGFPTARREGVVFYADNLLMEDGKVYFCDKVMVKATHYIAAANTIDTTTGTKRDSVKEEVLYTITPKNAEVSVSLTALEDVDFSVYTGLQATLTAWNDEGYFMVDKTATAYASPGTALVNSGTKAEVTTDRFIAKKGTDYLIGYMNRNAGIGNRAYLASNAANAFFTQYGKAYIPNVSGMTLRVFLGQTVFWNGGWTFTKALSCPNAKAAYFINNMGKRVYCVDFFAAGEGFAEVFPEDFNKEVEVIYKDSTITNDAYVTKGLKLVATGYGQIKFIVK